MICRLFTTYYKEPNTIRRAELDLCLAMNSAVVDSVYVLAERRDLASSGNLRCETIERRQTYGDLLGWAERLSEPDDISIITNCDIIIPPKAVEQMAAAIDVDDFYCLSRYEVKTGGILSLYDLNASQDVWAFRGKPKFTAHPDPFGIPGCDNRIALAAQKAGYRVLNPSRSIKTIHVHASRVRTATNSVRNRLPPPYLFITPHHLGEAPEYRVVNRIEELRSELVRCHEIKRSLRRETLERMYETKETQTAAPR